MLTVNLWLMCAQMIVVAFLEIAIMVRVTVGAVLLRNSCVPSQRSRP
jgi:hypothetical protein